MTEHGLGEYALIPELDVADLRESLDFYVEILGFRLRYQRAAEQFAYLHVEGAALMLQQADGPVVASGPRRSTDRMVEESTSSSRYETSTRSIGDVSQQVGGLSSRSRTAGTRSNPAA